MLEVTFWDVQHGNAAHIRTPNDRHIVVDLGDREDFSPLQTLYGQGVRKLDGVLVTHPHRDHIDDIFNFDLLAPLTLTTPRHLSDTDIRSGNRAMDILTVDHYLTIRRRYTAGLEPANALTTPENFGGVTFQVFSPQMCDSSNLNNHSLVLVVSYAGLKMVLPGDNEAPSWKELLTDPTFVLAVRGADVLLASHHGRDAGYCAELFDAMGKPKLVVISDGRFGDTSATDRYSKQATGWTVYNAIGSTETKKCVTTRNDGHITIKLGWTANDSNHRNFLNVKTSKPDMYSTIAQLLGGGAT